MLDGRIRNIRPFARCRSIRVAQAHFRIRRSTQASYGDGHLWRTFLAVASLVCSLPAAAAQDEAEPALRYRVEVSAPSEVRAAVERSLTLTHWQTYSDLTPEFLDLLIAEAKMQATDAVEAAGYFSATIDAEVDRETTPPTEKIRIQPDRDGLLCGRNDHARILPELGIGGPRLRVALNGSPDLTIA